MNLSSVSGAMRALTLSALTTLALSIAAPASADSVAYNATPNDTWFFGAGNNYAPANTAVLTTNAGDQLYARAHQTFVAAPPSVGNTYSFALGAAPVSFDWGIDSTSGYNGVTALITLTNLAGGSFGYDPLALLNDNAVASGSTQNSFRWNWVPFINFNPNVDGTYTFRLDVNGLAGGAKSLTYNLVIGNGFSAVPEPSTWALMIGGFGLVGVTLRRRRTLAA